MQTSAMGYEQCSVSKTSIWDTGKLNIFLVHSKRIIKIFCLKTQEMTYGWRKLQKKKLHCFYSKEILLG
jgi:hypothetical protein